MHLESKDGAGGGTGQWLGWGGPSSFRTIGFSSHLYSNHMTSLHFYSWFLSPLLYFYCYNKYYGGCLIIVEWRVPWDVSQGNCTKILHKFGSQGVYDLHVLCCVSGNTIFQTTLIPVHAWQIHIYSPLRNRTVVSWLPSPTLQMIGCPEIHSVGAIWGGQRTLGSKYRSWNSTLKNKKQPLWSLLFLTPQLEQWVSNFSAPGNMGWWGPTF